VAICGEMAGDPLCTELLLGLGVTNLSMSPSELLEVRNTVRSITNSPLKN
jgi:phosphotransferase system enzyme I (PtsI)